MRFYSITILSAILAPVFAAVHTVQIKNFSFMPAQVDISPGDMVTWTNADTVAHTATADGGSFDSGSIAPGKSFSHTFTAAGTLPYHCTIHPSMLAKVAIAANGTSTAPATTGTGTASRTASRTASGTATGTSAPPAATTTNTPSSGNILNAPIKVVLSIGGGVAALAQFL
ncbi:hypothetical protein BGZ88_003078 [Linnemannia elongata]|nr:hypothetical protein BGZ88_003078 [Linnemannia elongata]